MIPLASTTLTVKRPTEAEPGEGRTFTTVALRVRAVVGSPGGNERSRPGGGAVVDSESIQCDPIPGVTLAHTDVLVDDKTGLTYEVDTAVRRVGLGLDHVQIAAHHVAGVAD